jgi:hypothetical protein
MAAIARSVGKHDAFRIAVVITIRTADGHVSRAGPQLAVRREALGGV